MDIRPTKRADLAVLAGWPIAGAAGLWFALQGFRTPDPVACAVEMVGMTVLGLSQARFLPEGWARSPLWAGVLPVAWTVAVLGPGGLGGMPYWIGTALLAVVIVMALERRRRWGAASGVMSALFGAVLVRWLVLLRMADASAGDGQQINVAHSPFSQVLAEATRPLHRPPARESQGPPLVLITVDTLRADAVSSMEVFKRLQARGAWFDEAVSTSTWTVPAVASILSGRLPADHGAGILASGDLSGLGDTPTLATTLARSGYRTVAVATNAWLTAALGFDAGFDIWWQADERFHHRLPITGFPRGPASRDAHVVVDNALAWLETAPGRGWFLWVHLLDPHLPFEHAEDDFESALTDERLRAGLRIDAGRMARARAAYAREVVHVDGQLSRLLDALDKRGVLDKGVVAFTSDHGEEWWDHGGTGHGHQHHREIVQVPLAIAGGGIAAGLHPGTASLLDVPTTLAAAAGLAFGDGMDLRHPLPADRIVTSVGNAYFRQQRSSWGRGRRAIVLSAEPGAPMECFDHRSDPLEQRPVACAEGDPVSRAAIEARPPEVGGEVLVPKEALRALGYVE